MPTNAHNGIWVRTGWPTLTCLLAGDFAPAAYSLVLHKQLEHRGEL